MGVRTAADSDSEARALGPGAAGEFAGAGNRFAGEMAGAAAGGLVGVYTAGTGVDDCCTRGG